MGAELTEPQIAAVLEAVEQNRNYEIERGILHVRVRDAVEVGVPILTLANALGVSRSRIRRLAR